MSLLLDALKRAEDAKRAKKDDASGVEGELAAAAAAASASSPATSQVSGHREKKAAVPTALSLEEIRSAEPLAPEILRPSKPTKLTNHSDVRTGRAEQGDLSEEDLADIAAAQASSQRDQRDAAKNVFAAKQNVGQRAASSGKAKWLPAAVAIVLVAVSGAGWYVWQQVAALSASSLAPVSVAASSLPSSSKPPSSAPSLQPSASTIATSQAAEESATALRALPPLLPPPAKEMPLPRFAPTLTPAMQMAATGEGLTERELLAMRLKTSSGKSAKEAPVNLKLSQSIEPLKINPALLAGYAALSKGDYAQAKLLYKEATLAEPFNLDAELGMATAAARTGDYAAAVQHYRRALEIEPRNSTAISGILAISSDGKSDAKPEALEAEIKTWILKNPNSAALQFSLGNLYASEKRWTEAQQAYFEAYRIDSTNADYLYNLAVNLDQLNQTKLAVDYYQKALMQAAKTGGQFDRAAVQRRITELATVPTTNPSANLRIN